MKKLILTGYLIILFIYAYAQETKDTIKSTECLKIIGLAINENNIAIDGVEIKLYKQNEEIEEKEITNVEHHEHSFSFILESNEYYTIQISKPGYVKRSVVFYTDIPSDEIIRHLFIYEFEVILFKEKNIDDYYLDFPIALIRFNKIKKCFENNNNYTKYIKSKIKEAEKIEENKKQKNPLLKKSIVVN